MSEHEFPKYSVLMSVYAKENKEWLVCSIESMLNQTVKPSEFVIVEDGPLTDELSAVIDSYSSASPDLFKIVKIEKNGGLGPALRLGMENCTYDYVARMDSDDYSVPERMEKELEIFERFPNLGMVGSNVAEFCDSFDNVMGLCVLPEHNDEIIKFAKKRNPFRHPTMLYRKSSVMEAGNYREYHLLEDYDLFVRMIRSGCESYNVQENLVYVRVGSDFYKRRGGRTYLKSIKKFFKEQRSVGFLTKKEYRKTMFPRVIVCLLPSFLRDFIYRKMLRKK